MDPGIVAEALASAFLSGAWGGRRAIVERGRDAVGRVGWLAGVVRRMLAAFPLAPRDRFDVLAAHLASDRAILRACARDAPRLALAFGTPRLAMHTVRPPWPVRELATTGDVARWLGLTVSDLAWFADLRGLSRLDRGEPLDHYTRTSIPKRGGGHRLLEAPKRSLKEIQRRILRDVLDAIPTHDAVHGFRAGRGVCTHAAVHAGKRSVLRLDLADFFLAVRARRVHGLFRTAGYPQEVSRVLTGLCTTQTRLGPDPRFRERHLPQGAPTSPAIANLAAFSLDVRLAGAARTISATYTRYADDLVFSANDRLSPRFAALVSGIAIDEELPVNHRKTRWMTRAVRQEVTGLVVNAAPAVARDDFDRLKAILTNCTRTGPRAQNRDEVPDFRAHLEGRVAWVRHVQPARGERLARILAAIHW